MPRFMTYLREKRFAFMSYDSESIFYSSMFENSAAIRIEVINLCIIGDLCSEEVRNSGSYSQEESQKLIVKYVHKNSQCVSMSL